MEVSVLGPLEVKLAGSVVPIRPGIPRALLVWLALRPRELVTVDALIDRLWPEYIPGSPTNALQVQISYLRRVLREAGASADLISTRPGGYSLEVVDDAVDSIRSGQLVAAGRRAAAAGRLEEALTNFDEAVALWRSDPLPEIASHPAALGEVARLEELHVSCLGARFDTLLALGRHEEVVGELTFVTTEHPLREGFHGQLMVALYRCGRQAEALRAFERARRHLVDELGVEPGPELRRLEAQILAQDPELLPTPASQLVAAVGAPADMDGRDEFGDPSASAGFRGDGRLPVPVTPLLGRDREVHHLTGLLGRTRLLTLTGPGGAGKTRLGIEIAARHAGDVRFVDLAGVDSDAVVGRAVAVALGMATGRDSDPIPAIAQALADWDGLLVLDTCEHVVGGASRLVSEMLRCAPDVQVLATSRRPLGVAGEMAWPVPPLAVPPPRASRVEEVADLGAVALFCDRAVAASAEFELTEENVEDVVAICLALDGLPLAIELAAAQADVLSPAAIRRRLRDRFALLVASAVDGAERQRTLRATIDWSVQLLNEEERAFFVALSVFVGPFTIEAAASVGDVGDDDALRLVRSLVRHSVVSRSEGDRYRLLDSVRSFAAELLGQVSDPDAVRRRHAHYHAGMADESSRRWTASQELWVGRIASSFDDIRAAVRWAFENDPPTAGLLVAGLGWFCTLNGRLAEAHEWFERALQLDGVGAKLRARVLFGASLLAAPAGDLEKSRQLSAAAAAAAEEAGSGGLLVGALINLGVSEWATDRLEDASRTHERAAELAASRGDRWSTAMALSMRARTAIDTNDLEGAERFSTRALEVTQGTGAKQVEGLALEQLAQVHLRRGRLEEARRIATAALELQQHTGYREGEASSRHLVGLVLLAAGDLAKALEQFKGALLLGHEIGVAAAVAQGAEGIAAVALAADDPTTASRFLSTAARLRSSLALPVRPADRRRIDELIAAVGLDPLAPSVDELVAEIHDVRIPSAPTS